MANGRGWLEDKVLRVNGICCRCWVNRSSSIICVLSHSHNRGLKKIAQLDKIVPAANNRTEQAGKEALKKYHLDSAASEER